MCILVPMKNKCIDLTHLHFDISLRKKNYKFIKGKMISHFVLKNYLSIIILNKKHSIYSFNKKKSINYTNIAVPIS